MNRLPFLGLLFALLCLVTCRQMNEAHLLHLAEKQVNMNVDSVYALLVQIERPSQLSDEERLLYGWLNAYVHYKRHFPYRHSFGRKSRKLLLYGNCHGAEQE